MEKIIIHFGSDSDFSKLIEKVNSYYTIGDVIKHISKETIAIEGASKHFEAPLDVENLIIYTDDYGGIKEWAILGVSNNIFENPRIQIKNLFRKLSMIHIIIMPIQIDRNNFFIFALRIAG